MPTQAPKLGENQFQVEDAGKGKSIPSESQPGEEGWKPVIPSKTEPNPKLIITLLEDSLIHFIKVTDEIAVRIYVTVVFSDGKPDAKFEKDVPESGSVVFFPDSEGRPVEVDKIIVIPEGAKKPEAETYDMTVTLIGCFEPSEGE
jgi:hypothetical protein